MAHPDDMTVTRPFIRRTMGATLFLALFAGLTWLALTRDTAYERLRTTGILRIGYAVEPPYAFVSPTGRVTGESPELARLVAAELGIRHIEWVQADFDALIPDLLEGRFDVIAAGMLVTPERARTVRFSDPALFVTPGLLVRAGTPDVPLAYDRLVDHSSIRVAALAGSVEEQQLRAAGLPTARLLSVPDAAAGRAAVESGAVDALALSFPTLRAMEQARPFALDALPVAAAASGAPPDAGFFVAFAFAPRHGRLRQAWNAAQTGVLGSTAHLQAIAPFGFDASHLPGRLRAARDAAP